MQITDDRQFLAHPSDRRVGGEYDDPEADDWRWDGDLYVHDGCGV